MTAPEQKILDTLAELFEVLSYATALMAILHQDSPAIFDEASHDLAELIVELQEKKTFWVENKTGVKRGATE